jgi:hypothetical protein
MVKCLSGRRPNSRGVHNYGAVYFEALIPRLSKAGMPSRSEGWGGLFKDEQYRLIRSASRAYKVAARL